MRGSIGGLLVGLVLGLVVGFASGVTSVRSPSAPTPAAAPPSQPAPVVPDRRRAQPTPQRDVGAPVIDPAVDERTQSSERTQESIDASTEALLERVRATIAGEKGAHVAGVGFALAKHDQSAALDLASAIALLRSGTRAGRDTVKAVLHGWPNERLVELLRASAAETDAASHLAGVSHDVVQAAHSHSFDVPVDVVQLCLSSRDPERRVAGLWLAHPHVETLLDTVERIATQDAEPRVRSAAIFVLKDTIVDEDEHPARERVIDLIVHAFDDPSAEVRARAIEHLPTLGSRGFGVAMRILGDEATDESERKSAIAAVISSGRIAEFFATDPSPTLVRELGQEAQGVATESLGPLLPYLLRTVKELDDVQAEDLISIVSEIADADTLASIGRDSDVADAGRVAAVYALFDDPDDDAPLGAPRRRLGAEVFRELTDPTHASAALRRRAIRTVGDDYFHDDYGDPISPLVEQAVRHAALTDPSAIVRREAATVVEDHERD